MTAVADPSIFDPNPKNAAKAVNVRLKLAGGVERHSMDVAYRIVEVKYAKNGRNGQGWWFRVSEPPDLANWYTASAATIAQIAIEAGKSS